MTGHDPAGSWRLTPLPLPAAFPDTAAYPDTAVFPDTAAKPATLPDVDPVPPTDGGPTPAAAATPDATPDADADADPDADEFESTVRPYARVGGRTHVPAGLGLSIEALVRALSLAPHPDPPALTPEQHRILELTATSYQSLAELSAHLRLPIGVVRVVLADLLAAGLIQVYGRYTHDRNDVGLDILEGVLDGISTL